MKAKPAVVIKTVHSRPQFRTLSSLVELNFSRQISLINMNLTNFDEKNSIEFSLASLKAQILSTELTRDTSFTTHWDINRNIYLYCLIFTNQICVINIFALVVIIDMSLRENDQQKSTFSILRASKSHDVINHQWRIVLPDPSPDTSEAFQ